MKYFHFLSLTPRLDMPLTLHKAFLHSVAPGFLTSLSPLWDLYKEQNRSVCDSAHVPEKTLSKYAFGLDSKLVTGNWAKNDHNLEGVSVMW